MPKEKNGSRRKPFPFNKGVNGLNIKSICVFCGSNTGRDAEAAALTVSLGALLARRQIELVYGGADCGLMGQLADAALAHGGRVVGIIPEELNRRIGHRHLSELIVVGDMRQRKRLMLERADALIALPGGIGTLDEVFTVLAAKTLEKYKRRVVLYNAGGCWDELIKIIDTLSANGLITERREDLLSVANNIEELEHLLSE